MRRLRIGLIVLAARFVSPTCLPKFLEATQSVGWSPKEELHHEGQMEAGICNRLNLTLQPNSANPDLDGTSRKNFIGWKIQNPR